MSTTFTDQVQDYIKLRRGLGCRLDGQGKLLLDFGHFLDENAHQGPITTEVALRWANAHRSTNSDRTAQRLSTIRGFLRHRAGFEPATEIPPVQLLSWRVRRKPPHIYTQTEVDSLLNACKQLRPRNGLRPHTCETLFSLLLSTGLRISEALHLENRDVDLEAAVLTVRDSKFGKSRLVPLHATAQRPLERYMSHRDQVTPTSPSFFRTEKRATMTYSSVRVAFDTLRARLEWTAAGRSRRPRIQDMRHTFAVRCLMRWYREGIHPDRKIAHLATYLGHTEVRDTYWYLTAVPELAAIAIERFERFASQAQRVLS
ncbi:MAG: tyrosine-type recombinase/integrase [bacterium]|nr:tyrosine-type recombinase/integrase [bacterium]